MIARNDYLALIFFPQLNIYRADSDNSPEIDQAILNAVLKGMHRQTIVLSNHWSIDTQSAYTTIR